MPVEGAVQIDVLALCRLFEKIYDISIVNLFMAVYLLNVGEDLRELLRRVLAQKRRGNRLLHIHYFFVVSAVFGLYRLPRERSRVELDEDVHQGLQIILLIRFCNVSCKQDE